MRPIEIGCQTDGHRRLTWHSEGGHPKAYERCFGTRPSALERGFADLRRVGGLAIVHVESAPGE